MSKHKKPTLVDGVWVRPDGTRVTDKEEISMLEAGLRRMARERLPNGRWRPGVSGNSLGRPRSKHQRAVSKRQYRRDVLRVTEELVPAKIGDTVKMLPFHVVNLMSIRAKANQGHAPSQRYLDKLHYEAVEEHEDANPLLTNGLEKRELEAVARDAKHLEHWRWRALNLFRKFSWRI